MPLVLLAAMAIFGAAAAHSDGEPSPSDFRADSRLVLVPVIVTDHRGATVNGLTVQAFTVLEDKTPQPIVSFSEEDVPCSVAIVFDFSGSMTARLPEAKQALGLFFDLAGPEDEALLVSVSDRPHLRSGFTHDIPFLRSRVAAEHGGGSTALVDSIYTAIFAARKAHNHRRALFIISDGMDNHSRRNSAELMSWAQEAGVEIHTVALEEPQAPKKPLQWEEQRRGREFLEELASRSGGLHFVVRDENDMREAAASIGKALRSQYVIGYRPASVPDGKRHYLQIKLARPDAHAHARGHYVSE